MTDRETSYVEFELVLHSGNDAIIDNPNERVAAILDKVAAKLRSGNEDYSKIFDANGNKVGYFQLDID
jgi:hypothetical protein